MLLVGVVLSCIRVVVAIIGIAIRRLAGLLLIVLRVLLVWVLAVVATRSARALDILRVRVVPLLRGGRVY